MKNKQKITTFLMDKIEEEGFDYCFDGYSDWDEIEDEKFHELKSKYLDAKNDLIYYINKL